MFTRADAIAAETYWARQLHVPEGLAHAVAEVESHHNPYAVGDQGTSFGDYQLHRGGMLGKLTPQQAFDPFTNARVAIANLAYTLQRNPGADPGRIAALSQRPADPEGYARKVNAAMQTSKAGASNAGVQTTTLAAAGGTAQPVLNWQGPGNWVWDHTGGWVLHGAGNVAGDVGGAIAAPFVAIFNLFSTVWDFFTSADTWVRIGLFVGGGIVIVLGLKAIAGGGGGGASVVPVPV